MNTLKTLAAIFCAAIVLNSCKQKDFPSPAADIALPDAGNAKIMLVHTDPRLLNRLNFYLDGQQVNSDSLSYEEHTSYMTTTALTHIIKATSNLYIDSIKVDTIYNGAGFSIDTTFYPNYFLSLKYHRGATFTIVGTDTTISYYAEVPNTTFLTTGFHFGQNKSYTLFDFGTPQFWQSLVIGDSANYIVLEDDLNAISGKAKVRFINLTSDLNKLILNTGASNDLGIDAHLDGPGGTPPSISIADNADFANWTNFTQIDPGTYDLNIFLHSNLATSIFTKSNIQLDAGKIYTIYTNGYALGGPKPIDAGIVVHN
jgi:hypothetical protein